MALQSFQEKEVSEMELELKRQIIHAMGIFSIVVIYYLGKQLSILLLSLFVIFWISWSQYRVNKKRIKFSRWKIIKMIDEKAEKFVEGYERKTERRALPLKGAIFFYLGALLVVIIFPTNIAMASIAVLALGDSLSTLVGRKFGKHKAPLNEHKTIQGSLAFFTIAFIVLLFFTNPLRALITAVLGMFVEMLPLEDNLTVPLSVGILLWI